MAMTFVILSFYLPLQALRTYARKARVWALLAATCAPYGPLAADSHSCTLETWVNALNSTANAYVSAIGTPSEPAAVRAFRTEMNRYSRDQLVSQINAAQFGDNSAALKDFVTARRHLLDLSQDNWPQMASRLGADPRFDRQSASIETYFAATDCDPDAEDFLTVSDAESSMLDRLSSGLAGLSDLFSDKEPPQVHLDPLTFDPDNFEAFTSHATRTASTGPPLTLTQTGNIAFVLGVFTFLLALAVWIWMRYGIAQRRAMRYTCSLPIAIFDGAQPDLGELRDLSQLGAKFETDARLEPRMKIAVTLGPYRRKARVAWMNNHFVGVKFDTALSDDEMAELLGPFAARVAAARETDHKLTDLIEDTYGSAVFAAQSMRDTLAILSRQSASEGVLDSGDEDSPETVEQTPEDMDSEPEHLGNRGGLAQAT